MLLLITFFSLIIISSAKFKSEGFSIALRQYEENHGLENGGPREKVPFLQPFSRQVNFFQIPAIPVRYWTTNTFSKTII